MDELPTCTHVLARDGSGRRASSGAAPPDTRGPSAPPGPDTGRSRAKRVGGGPVGAGAVVAGGPVDTITLDATERHRRRVRLESDGGIAFLLDLPAARLLREGDLLVLSDRRTVEVRAAPEALYEVRGAGPVELLRLAWHVGNRHLPTEVHEDHLLIREDPVIRTMLEGLGATVRERSAGFDPEGGAYGGGAGHGHGGHDHGGHDHGPGDPGDPSDAHRPGAEDAPPVSS